MIGVVGALGAVGQVAAARLAARGDLRVGGRDRERTAALAARLGAQPRVVDATDPASLTAFAGGCTVVLNCAGPAAVLGGSVAAGVLAAGACYVDAAGDDELAAAVAAHVPAEAVAVVSAGMMPGLTGLVPRVLAAGMPPGGSLAGWTGGLDRFSAAGAHDYVAAAATFGSAGTLWRDGRRVPDREGPGTAAPTFGSDALTLAFLSTELERAAAALGLREASWRSVVLGARVRALLSQPPAGTATEQADRLVRAAALDSFADRTFHQVSAGLTVAGRVRSLLVRAAGASELTGLVAASATLAVAGGDVPAGTHHAAEVLDPARVLAELAESPLVSRVEVVDAPLSALELVEEGAL